VKLTGFEEFTYRSLPPAYKQAPALEIIMQNEGAEIAIIALLDSGSEYSVFSYSIGRNLGLSVERGQPITLSTGAGSGQLQTYRHRIDQIIIPTPNGQKWIVGNPEVQIAERDIGREILGRYNADSGSTKCGCLDR